MKGLEENNEWNMKRDGFEKLTRMKNKERRFREREIGMRKWNKKNTRVIITFVKYLRNSKHPIFEVFLRNGELSV